MMLRDALAARLLGWLPPGRASRRLLVVVLRRLRRDRPVPRRLGAVLHARHRALSNAEVGLGLSLSAVAGFVCSVPLGRIADRFGTRAHAHRRLPVARLGLRSPTCSCDDVPGFIAVACLLGIGPVGGRAARAGDGRRRRGGPLAGADDGGDERRPQRGLRRSARCSATLAIAADSATGYRALVVGDALSFFFAAALLARSRRWPRAAAAQRRGRGRGARASTCATCARRGERRAVPAHRAARRRACRCGSRPAPRRRPTLVGAVVLLNTVLAIALGMRLSRGADGLLAGGARQPGSGWSLAACCGLRRADRDGRPGRGERAAARRGACADARRAVAVARGVGRCRTRCRRRTGAATT